MFLVKIALCSLAGFWWGQWFPTRFGFPTNLKNGVLHVTGLVLGALGIGAMICMAVDFLAQ